MSSNYPDGAANDPRAPWNQKDPKECSECDGAGKIDWSREDGQDECEVCKGTGEIEIEDDGTEKDWDAIAKDDRIQKEIEENND